ncbi:MAG: hypothetical protein U9Q82_08390, partial [Chloroflexota bacterium]|nr:hypothetical protein [Chloroflexota bacterium]
RENFARFPGVLTGLLWLLMGLMQPLTVLLAWAVVGSQVLLLGADQLWCKRKTGQADWAAWRAWLWRAVRAGLVSSPLVIYTAWAFNSDPVLKMWTAQNLLPSPHPWHYLAAYGLLVPFVVVVMWKRMRTSMAEFSIIPSLSFTRRDRKSSHPMEVKVKSSLLIAWMLIFPFLIYAPYPLQRRLAEGFWVVLVAVALAYFDASPADAPARRLAYIPLILTFPTTLLLLIGGAQVAAHPSIPVFRPAAQVEAFQFLDAKIGSQAVVLSSYETGNALPAWAPAFVVIGHGPESVGLDELAPRVEGFYQADTPDDERLALLHEFDVDYVFWGPAERALGDWKPYQVDFLEVIYNQAGYCIYQQTGQ